MENFIFCAVLTHFLLMFAFYTPWKKTENQNGNIGQKWFKNGNNLRSRQTVQDSFLIFHLDIELLLFPLKSSENNKFSDNFKGNRS